MKLVECDEPFYHAVIDDVLSEQELGELAAVYGQFTFREIHTDLFKFLQTEELSGSPNLRKFRKRLDGVFQRYSPQKDRFYNIFGSYYRKGDYLLCHDDLVDSRIYAFTFYLEDFKSGELVLYENDCRTTAKRIAIARNRMVVFKVGLTSYHEVGFCTSSGRKAISGWLNYPEHRCGAREFPMELTLPPNIVKYEIAVELPCEERVARLGDAPCDGEVPEEQLVAIETPDLPYVVLGEQPAGVFISRRCTEINTEFLYVPDFSGYECIHAQYLRIDPHGYILCNDAINTPTGHLLDVFEFDRDSAEAPSFVTYAKESGDFAFGLDAVPGITLMVLRMAYSICIIPGDRTVTFRHFIFRKNE
ncbi:prolyl 3-hydroxylase /prolyl 3,4-dihydroxylase [Pancytospora philotis]|nr:prolyl 3-hydroxylase /prolyl 3,4-dihydroxylase [Pancytospora philotis]